MPNKNDQYHLTVYWSEEDGWVVTEMEPASDGFIWSEEDEEWSFATFDEDNQIYAKMINEFYNKLWEED